MTFFVTSVGSGKGADLGGLEGADRLCQALAQAAGATGKTWRAYLSTQGVGGATAINARDRIGRGPWQNAKGVVIAKDVAELHGNNGHHQTERAHRKGAMVNGRGDTPNTHDMLTGSQPDGTAFAGAAGPDLRQLDEERHGRRGDARSSRPHRDDDDPRRNRGTRLTRPAAAAARMR